MTLASRLLLGLIACELLAGSIAIGLKLAAPRPPLADLSYVDSITAGDLRALAASIGTGEDWRKLGEAYMATGFFREAEACHRMAAQGDSQSAEAVQQWAMSLERLGSLDAANAAYGRAGQLDPARSAKCAYFIARDKLRQEDVAGARQALVDAGDLPAARYAIARLVIGEGRRDEAVAILKGLAHDFPTAQQPWLMLHRIALAEERLPEAWEAAERQDAALEQLPTPFDADFQRLRSIHDEFGLRGRWREARSRVEDGDLVASEQMLRPLLAVKFDAFPADWLAEALFQQGRLDEAARMQQEIIERHGPNVEYLERLGDTLDALGRKDEARAAWLRATQLSFGPPLRDVHGKLAASLAAVGQEELATRHYARAAQAAGIGQLRAGNLAEAETALRESVRLDPQLAHAWYYVGEAARQRGNVEAARDAYERCLSIQPHHGRAADRLQQMDNSKVTPAQN